MNNRTTLLVLPAVLIAAAVSGCVQETSEIETPGEVPEPGGTPPDAAQPAPTSAVTAPSAPISLDISFSDAPALNQTAEVTCTITSVIDAFNTTAEIVLPEGLAMVGGDLSWKGDLYGTHVSKVNASENTTIQFKAVVKAVKTGDWIVEVSAKSMSEHGWTGIGGRELVYVSIHVDSASVSDSPPPDPYAGVSKKAVRIDPPDIVDKKPLKRNKIVPKIGNISESELRRVPDSLVGVGGLQGDVTRVPKPFYSGTVTTM